MIRTRYTLLFLFSFIVDAVAQHPDGITFDDSLNWDQTISKAKDEDKIVFVNVSASWCVPCHEMEKNIFTQKEVGDFFNNNFINASVEMDKKDDGTADAKVQLSIAHQVNKVFNITSYPTYLFISPEGSLIHYFGGATTTAQEFLSKAKMALDPKKQMVLLAQQYRDGKRSRAFLVNLISAARAANRTDSLSHYVNDYLKLDTNWRTASNIDLIAIGTSKSTDVAYGFLIKNQALIDSVRGKGTSKTILKTIAYDEVVLPMSRLNAKKQTFGPMVLYSGDPIKNIDWNLIEDRLQDFNPDVAEEVLYESKPGHYQALGDWDSYHLSLLEYVKKPNIYRSAKFGSFLQAAALFCKDTVAIEKIVSLCENMMRRDQRLQESNAFYYSIMLYNVGRRQKAIEVLDRYVSTSGKTDKDAIDRLSKMKRGDAL